MTLQKPFQTLVAFSLPLLAALTLAGCGCGQAEDPNLHEQEVSSASLTSSTPFNQLQIFSPGVIDTQKETFKLPFILATSSAPARPGEKYFDETLKLNSGSLDAGFFISDQIAFQPINSTTYNNYSAGSSESTNNVAQCSDTSPCNDEYFTCQQVGGPGSINGVHITQCSLTDKLFFLPKSLKSTFNGAKNSTHYVHVVLDTTTNMANQDVDLPTRVKNLADGLNSKSRLAITQLGKGNGCVHLLNSDTKCYYNANDFKQMLDNRNSELFDFNATGDQKLIYDTLFKIADEKINLSSVTTSIILVTPKPDHGSTKTLDETIAKLKEKNVRVFILEYDNLTTHHGPTKELATLASETNAFYSYSDTSFSSSAASFFSYIPTALENLLTVDVKTSAFHYKDDLKDKFYRMSGIITYATTGQSSPLQLFESKNKAVVTGDSRISFFVK